jgi:hypothetical protein
VSENGVTWELDRLGRFAEDDLVGKMVQGWISWRGGTCVGDVEPAFDEEDRTS